MYFVRPPYLIRKIYRNAVWNIPAKENIIYLTFDDGPDPEITPWVLDTLKKYNAKATFFCIGENIQKYPAIFKQIIEHNHAVGNHTFSHLNGWKTKTKEYLENVEKCNSFFLNLFPTTNYQLSTNLFRPPYGKMRKSQYSILNTQYSIIMWDVLSGDFDKNTNKEKCLVNVIANTKKGSVVVFHDSVKAKVNLYYTLPRVLNYFAKKEFEFKAIALS